jgi:excisionase family DNA binding protein
MTPEEHYISAMDALERPGNEQQAFVAEFRRSLIQHDMRVLEDYLYGSESEVLTADETAEFLGFNPVTIRLKARSGEIPGRKIGKEWRFSRTALLEWIGEGSESESPPLPPFADTSTCSRCEEDHPTDDDEWCEACLRVGGST